MTSVDRECVERVQAGDPAALADLYDRHAALLHPLALRITGNAADADEALFEAWLQVCQRSVSFGAGGSVAGWLLSLVRERSLARRRAEGSQSGDGAGPSGPIEVSPERVDLAERATEALGLLDDHERAVLELAYFDGLTQTETAERLGANPSDVMKWTRDGLGHLSAALPGEEAA